MTFISKTAVALASAGMFFTLTGLAIAEKAGSDFHFAKEAAEGGMFEVAMGKVAVQKAQNNDVKQFGQRMIDDHSKAGDQLKGLASRDNLVLPDTLNAKDQATINRLSNLTGSTFDREYMRQMVMDHETDIAAFQREANDGTNADLRNWASNTLPTLHDHLRQAKETQRAIGFVSSNHFSRK